MLFTKFSSGNVFIAMAGADAVAADGNVIYISFTVKKDVRGTVTSPLIFSKMFLNDDDFTSISKAGSIMIEGKPKEFVLEQNYPNPFNPSTTIRYQIPDDATHVTMMIYNELGELVKILMNEKKDAGAYELKWDGRSDVGLPVSSGCYFYRFVAVGRQTYTAMKKMVVVK